MVRVLCAADLHLGLLRHSAPGRPKSRLADFTATLRRFVAVANERADLAILAGDTLDSRLPTPEINEALAEALFGLVVPVVITEGNHDGKLVVADATTDTLGVFRVLARTGWHVFTQPEVRTVHTKAGPVVIAGVPFPHKRSFDQLRADLDPDDRTAAIGVAMDELVRGLFTQAEARDRSDRQPPWEPPRILVGHFTAAGGRTGTERTMSLDWDVTVSLDVLDLWDYAALGHLHNMQRAGAKGYYPGSPEYIDFGEVGQRKGFLLAEVQRGQPPVVTRIDSQPRPFVILTHDLDAGALTFDQSGPTLPTGAVVRLDLSASADPGQTAFRAASRAAYAAGASYVKIVKHLPPRVARVGAIDPGASPLDLTRGWLEEQGVTDIGPYLAAAAEVMAAKPAA